MSVAAHLLGHPHLWVGSAVTRLPAGKMAALLYYLAFRQGWVSRGELTLLFWPEADEKTARMNLRQLLTTLKRLPYVTLETDATYVRWAVPSDAAVFRAACERGDRTAAVAAYTGPLLQDFDADAWPDFGEWLGHTRAQLAGQFVHEVLALVGALEQTERSGAALTTLGRAHALEPLHEPILRAYLRGLYGAGQTGRMQTVFETFGRTLQGAVDGEPEEETTALVARLGALNGSGAPLTPHNLPLPRTTFVGRASDQATLRAKLGDPWCRLLTLVGPGGIGKTRLALEVAASLVGVGSFPDGVFFVSLAPITEGALLGPAIAEALGLTNTATEGSGPLTVYLKDKALLLLLDNLEQLTGASAVVADLLDACGRLKLLVTSREALGVYGEHEHPVPPLSLPHPVRSDMLAALHGSEAAQVFVQRARDVQPDFALTPDNAPAVAELCHRLDGLPLALELAAARVRLFSPQALSARLGGRLHLLTAGARTLPRRQQTLRDAIGWSFDLLAPAEQTLFRRLAVFVGGASLEGVAAVGERSDGDALDLIDALVRKSLIKQVPGPDGEPRFDMLETIYAFAAEQLAASGEEAAARRAHARFFWALALESETALRGSEQVRWLGQLEAEHDNLRAALRWAGAHDPDLELELVGALFVFWDLRSHFAEGRTWLEAALGRATGAPSVARAKALNAAGTLARMQGDHAASLNLLTACLELYEHLGDPAKVAAALNNLGHTAENQHDLAAAHTYFERALTAYRSVGERWGEASVLNNLGNIVHAENNLEAARPLFEASLSRFRELGDDRSVAMALGNLGELAAEEGDHVKALPLLNEAVAALWSLGDSASTLYVLERLAASLAHGGDPARAAQLYGATAALREAMSIPLEAADQGHCAANLATVRAALSPDAWAETYQAGSLLTLEATVTLALETDG